MNDNAPNTPSIPSTVSTLRILISTDNHLGYMEKDPIRGNDSFDTFAEILHIATTKQVDCILLGGDLFHENKPSRETLHKSMELLRRHCLGSRPCAVQLLSDPAANFASPFGTVNYEDPNYNISMPVFIIHGNHDDPTGELNLSSIDLLSTAGLLNYFGKTSNVDDIALSPILLQKGITRFALYGIGGIRDERLHRTFQQQKVKFIRPSDPNDSWFSMMILHQNRTAHGKANYIPEEYLPDFLDFVLWGHEHECQACEPTTCPTRGITVCQPGSSVATSLSEGETKTKHTVILEINQKQMSLVPIQLESVRPFLMRDVCLREIKPSISLNDTKAINEHLCAQVEEMLLITQADTLASAKLPLIRLRVDYTSENFATNGHFDGTRANYAIGNIQRFGQQFEKRIANPRDLLQLLRRRKPALYKKSNNAIHIDAHSLSSEPHEAVRVEDLVTQLLKLQKLDLFPHNEFNDTIKQAVERNFTDTIGQFVKDTINRTIKCTAIVSDSESLRNEFDRIRKLREDEWQLLHTIPSDPADNHLQFPINDENRPPEENCNDDQHGGQNYGQDNVHRFEHALPPIPSKRPSSSTKRTATTRGRRKAAAAPLLKEPPFLDNY